MLAELNTRAHAITSHVNWSLIVVRFIHGQPNRSWNELHTGNSKQKAWSWWFKYRRRLLYWRVKMLIYNDSITKIRKTILLVQKHKNSEVFISWKCLYVPPEESRKGYNFHCRNSAVSITQQAMLQTFVSHQCGLHLMFLWTESRMFN